MSPAERLRGLGLELGLGSEPERVLEPLKAFYRQVDGALASAAEGLGLPCRAGCDACCREAVFLSAPEFLLIAAVLFDNPPLQSEVVPRMLSLAARFADELELLEVLPAGRERDEVASRVKFDCPLLDAGGRCRVHAARELNARTFGQAWDEHLDGPFGCGLTHERLTVLGGGGAPSRQGLPGARAWRESLREQVPGVGDVHVYPWWFDRYRTWME